ncbi:MAG: toll/interleukin-1 receptor domain-containing protein [Planctomycetota bacterium]
MKNRFHVALSFPSEHRGFVRDVAESLAVKLTPQRVFYDEWYEAELLGSDGDLKLQLMYEQADLIVPFFSRSYNKPWCLMEWESIRGLLLDRRKDDSVIPVHIDDTEVPGWSAVNFGIRLQGGKPQQIASIILQALAMRTSATNEVPFGLTTRSAVPRDKDPLATPPSHALEIWREKLDYLQQQEATASVPEQKFAIKKSVEEAKQKIREIGEDLTARAQQDAVAGKVPPRWNVISPEVQPPPIRPILRELEWAISGGDLLDSELGREVVAALQDERNVNLANPFDALWMVAAIRAADSYFTPIGLSAGQRDWQLDFAKASAPILVGLAWSLERSPDAQAIVLGLCNIVAERLRLKLKWPADPDESNDLKNAIYRACLDAGELECEQVLVELQGLKVTGPA